MIREADQAEPIGPQQPTLIVVAGPNGAGKTSLTEEVLRHRWADLVLEQVIQIQPANPDHDPWEDSH